MATTPLPKIGSSTQQPQGGGGLLDYVVKGVENAASAVEKSPQFQQMAQSPMGQLVQGKFGNVIPALKEEFTQGTIGGKKYQPQMAIGGEMEEVPGAGFSPSGLGAEGTNTWSQLVRDPKTNELVSNPNFQAGSASPVKFTQDTSAADKYTAQPAEPAQPQVQPQQPEALQVQAAPAIPKPNILTRMGTAITSDVGKTVSPKAVDNPFGPEYTQDMQSALLRNGVDHYNQAPAAARNLYDNVIGPELKNNPQSISLDDLTQQIVAGMQKMKPGLDPREAKIAAADVINNMYDVSRNTGQAAQTIDTPSLLKIKTDLNSTLPVRNLYDRGIPPQNSTDLATVVARNTLGDVVAKMHPAVAQATKDYGLISDAMPSLFKAAQEGRGIGVRVGSINVGIPSAIGGPIRDVTGGGLRLAGQVADSPLGKILGKAGLLAGGVALGAGAVSQIAKQQKGSQAQDVFGGVVDQGVDHGGTIAHPVKTVNDIPDVLSGLSKGDDTYQPVSPDAIQGSDGNSLGISNAAYQQQRQKLETTYGQQVVNNPQLAAQTKAQIDNLDTKYADPMNQKLNNSYTDVQTQEQTIQTAKNTLKTVSPSLAQLFGVGKFSWDTLRTQTDPKYDTLKQELNNIVAVYPPAKDLLSEAKTQKGVQNIITAAHLFVLTNYYTQLNTASGGQTTTGQAAPQAQQLPPQSQSMPAPRANTANWAGVSSPTSQSMPSIPNFQQVGAGFAGQ
ncbi:MAG TPA: hypothetical protein VF941_11825 [Clostridia bacterium]